MLTFKQYLNARFIFESIMLMEAGVTGASGGGASGPVKPPKPTASGPTGGSPPPKGLSHIAGGSGNQGTRGPAGAPMSGLQLFGAALNTLRPASEYAANASGRYQELDVGIKNRWEYYRNLGGAFKNAGGFLSGISGVVGGAIGSLAGKLGSAAGSGLGDAAGKAAGIFGQALGAFGGLLNTGGKFGDEFATVMTSAFYDPRAAAQAGNASPEQQKQDNEESNKKIGLEIPGVTGGAPAGGTP